MSWFGTLRRHKDGRYKQDDRFSEAALTGSIAQRYRNKINTSTSDEEKTSSSPKSPPIISTKDWLLQMRSGQQCNVPSRSPAAVSQTANDAKQESVGRPPLVRCGSESDLLRTVDCSVETDDRKQQCQTRDGRLHSDDVVVRQRLQADRRFSHELPTADLTSHQHPTTVVMKRARISAGDVFCGSDNEMDFLKQLELAISSASRTIALQRVKDGFGFSVALFQRDGVKLPRFSRVVDGSVAHLVGVRVGDFLVELNGTSVVGENADNCDSLLQNCGEVLTMKVATLAESFGMRNTADFPATERRWSLLCDAVSLNESEDSLNSGDHRTSTNSVSGCRIDKKSAEVSRTTTGATRPSLLIDGSNPASVRGRVEPMTAELQKRLMTSRHPLIPFGSNGCTAAVGSSFQSASSSSEDDGSIRIETPTSGYGSAADVGSDDSAGVVLPPLARSPVAAGVAATDDAGVSVSRVKALSSHLNLSFGSGATQSLGERRTGAGSSSSDGIGTFSLSAPKCKLGDFNEHYEELPPLKSPPSTATRAPSPPPLRPTSRMVNGKTGIDEQSKPSEIALQRPPAAGASDESVVFRRKNLPLTSDPAVEDFLSKAETMRREFVRQSRLAQAELVTVGISTTTDKKPAPSSLLPAPVAAAAAASGSASSSAAAAAAPAAEAVIATAPRRNSALASHQSTNYPEVDSAGDLPVAESAFSAAIRKGVGCLRKSTTSDLGQRNNSSDASTPTEELPAFQLARKGSENRLGEAVGSRIERQSNSPAVSITGSLPTSGSLVSNSKPKPPAPPKLAAESTKTAAAPPVNTSVGVSVAAASLTSNQKEPPRRQNVTDKPPPPFRRTSSTASLINNPALSPTSSALMPWLTNESQHQSVPANDGLTFPLPPPSGFAESEAPSSTISAGGKQAPRPKVAPKLTTRSSSISLDQFSVDAERVVTADSTRSTSTSSCQQSFLQKATSFDQKLPPPSSSSPAAVTFVTADTDCCSPSVPLAVVPAVIPPPPIFYDGPSKPSMTSTKPTARPVANCKPIPPVPRKPLLSNYAPSNNFPTPSSRSLGAVNVTSAPADDGSSSSSNNNCKVIPLPIPPPAAYDDGRQQESATFDCQLLPPPPPFPAKIDTGDTTGKRNGGSRQATTGGHPVCDWTVDDVGDWLETIQLGKHRERFRIGGVDGRQLVELDRGKFIELGVTDVGDRMSIERQLMKLSKK